MKCENKTRARFRLGSLYMTPEVRDAIAHGDTSPFEYLGRHIRGDWGIACEEDCNANERALVDAAQVWSVYETSAGDKLWIITEADRSQTTIFLPNEY